MDILKIGTLVFIVALFIWIVIKSNFSSKKIIKNDLDKIALENAIKSKILDILSNDNSYNYVSAPTYRIFKEFYKAITYNEITTRIELEGNEYLGINKDIPADNITVSNILYKLLDSQFVDNVIESKYNSYNKNIQDNIKSAEEIESEAVKYHESFGQEPTGDPVLHPKDSNNDESNEDADKFSSIDELVSTGTVEDIEN